MATPMSQDQFQYEMLKALQNLQRSMTDSLRSAGGDRAGAGGSGGSGRRSRVDEAKTQAELANLIRELADDIRDTQAEMTALTAAGKVRERRALEDFLSSVQEELQQAQDRERKWSITEAANLRATALANRDRQQRDDLIAAGVESSITKLSSSLSDLERAPHSDWQAFEKYSFSMNKSVERQSSILSGMIEGSSGGLDNEIQDKYVQSVLKSSRSLDLFNKRILELEAKGKKVDTAQELSEVLNDITTEARVFERLSKDNNGKIQETIENLYQMNEAGGDIGEAGRKVLAMARKYELLSDTGVAKSDIEFQNHITSVKQDIITLQKHAVAEMNMAKISQKLHDKFGELGQVLSGQKGAWGAVAFGAGLFAANIGDAINQWKIAADVGMATGTGFTELKEAQFKLGLSFEQTAKIFQENRRLAYSVGSDGVNDFTNAVNKGKLGLIRLGVGAEEAAQTAVDFAKNAAQSGIDIRDSEKLNKAINSQTAAYGRLKLLTGASVSEFKALNDELLTSASVQDQMTGMNVIDRQKNMDAMMQLREDFVKLGMSATTANKALIAFKDIGKQKIADRFTTGAKLQQAMGMLGMQGGAEARSIMIKGQRATPEEQKRLTQILAEVKRRSESAEFRKGSYGKENQAQSILDPLVGPGGILETLAQAGAEAKKTNDALGKIEDSQLAKQTVEKDLRIPETIAHLIDIEASLKQVVGDPIVKSLGGLALIATGIGTELGIISALVSKIALAAGISPDKLTSAAGKLGSMKGLLLGSGAGIAAYAGMSAWDYASDDIEAKHKAKAKGENISERTWYNDWGMMPLIGKYVPDFMTELDEYDPSGRKLTEEEKKKRKGITTSTPKDEDKKISDVAPKTPDASTPTVTPPKSTASPTITPIGASTSGTSSTDDEKPIKLHDETIQKIGLFLTALNETETKSLNIEQDQLDLLAALVSSDAEAKQFASKLQPLPGHNRMFGAGTRFLPR